MKNLILLLVCVFLSLFIKAQCIPADTEVDIVTNDCINFEYVITATGGEWDGFTQAIYAWDDDECVPIAICSTNEVFPPFSPPIYSPGGEWNYFGPTGACDNNGSLGCILTLQSKNKWLVDNAVVIKAYNGAGTCRSDGEYVSFFEPEDLGCKSIDSITTSKAVGDFFECGCTNVLGTIHYTNGDTYDFDFNVKVICNINSPFVCKADVFTVEGDINDGSAQIDFLEFVEGGCGSIAVNNIIDITNEMAIMNFAEYPCGSNSEFEVEYVDENGSTETCSFFVEVSCNDAEPCTPEPQFSDLYWSSYMGSDSEDEVMDATLDENSEMLYVIGKTESNSFPNTTNVIGTLGSGSNTFVSCINPDASLNWTTIIAGWEDPHGIELDESGNLILVGITNSSTLPGTSDVPGYDKTFNGGQDILILKLDSDGQSIVYSSFYGGSGDEDHNDFKLEFEYHNNLAFIVGSTTSTDLPVTSNNIDSNPGNTFIASIDLEDNIVKYTSFYLSPSVSNTFVKSDALTLDVDGRMILCLSNGGNAYDALISPDAIISSFDNTYFPILLVFDSSFNVEYGTYISPYYDLYGPNNCTDFGTPDGGYDMNNFDLEIDIDNNIYLLLNSAGFKQPIFDPMLLLNSESYFPPVDSLICTINAGSCPNLCRITTGSTIMKIRRCENGAFLDSPVIENMIFQGFSGNRGSIGIDDSGRTHYITSNWASISPSYYNNDPSDFGKNRYFVYESDVPELSEIIIESDANTDHSNGILVSDYKAYTYGKAADGYVTTSSWENEDGVTNSIIQASHGGGNSDGFITVFNNNDDCMPLSCNDDEPVVCENVVMDFAGDNNDITVASPLSQSNEYTIGLSFKDLPGGVNIQKLLYFTNTRNWSVPELSIFNGKLAYTAGTWKISNEDVEDNMWHQVYLTKDATRMKMYLDGVLIMDNSIPNFLAIDGTIYIGGTGGHEYNGMLDDIQIWNKSLTEDEISWRWSCPVDVNEDGLILYYDFEEGIANGNNTSITQVMDNAESNDGELSNFQLTGNTSNFICGDLEYNCVDPCEKDEESPVCISSDLTIDLAPAGSVSIQALSVDGGSYDDCSEVRLGLDRFEFTCDDLGENTVTLTVIDESGNSSSCTAVVALTDDEGFCLMDCENVVMNFDGIDDHITIEGIYTESQYTIMAWFRSSINNVGAEDRIFSFGNSDRLEVGIEINGNLWIYDQNCCSPIEYTIVRDGQWHHVAIVIDNSMRKVYLDLAEIDQFSSSTDLYGPNMRLGSWAAALSSPTFFTGDIDEYRVYQEALSIGQICEIANTQSSILSSALLVHFNFEEGIAEGDNQGITEIINQGSLGAQITDNLDKIGQTSNYICSDLSDLTCINPCEKDEESPVCISSDLTINLAPAGSVSIQPLSVDGGSYDDCSEVRLGLDRFEFTCDDLGENTVTLTVIDESGNNSSCTAVVTLTDDEGFCLMDCENVVMDFAGDNNDITVASPLSQGNEYTIGLSFKDLPGGVNIQKLLYFTNTRNWSVPELSIFNGKLAYTAGTWKISNEDVEDNMWHQVYLTKDATRMKMYLDGVLIMDNSIPNFLAIDGTIYIGGTGGHEYNGMLDDIQIWNKSLTEDEISWRWSCPVDVNEDGLILYYDFEEGIANGNNTSITQVMDNAESNDGELSNFQLTGNTSNFICGELEYSCVDPCENDLTPPEVNCPSMTLELPLQVNGEVAFSSADLDLQATDNCSSVLIPVIEQTFDCDDTEGVFGWLLNIEDESGNITTCSISATVTDPQGYCLCLDDQTAPILTCDDDLTFSIPASGMLEVSAMDINAIAIDDCSNPEVQLVDNEFDCENLGENLIIVAAINDAGLVSNCVVNVLIEDGEGICSDCCDDPDVFNANVNQGFQIQRDACDIQVSSLILDECSQVMVDLGNGDIEMFNGNETYVYSYSQDGDYDLVFNIIQYDSDVNICNEGSWDTMICVECNMDCENPMIAYDRGFVKPNLSQTGSSISHSRVNKYSDVFLKDGITYSAASLYSDIDYGYDVYVFKDGTEIIRIQGKSTLNDTINNDEVSEIFVDENDNIYITGSFKSQEISFPSLNSADEVTLYNNPDFLGLEDAFVAKYDNALNLIWAFDIGNNWVDNIEDFHKLSENEFVIVGATRIDADFDPNGAGVYSGIESAQKSFVAKYTEANTPGLKPSCDWVNIMLLSQAGVIDEGHTHALGITSYNDRIFACGDYASGNTPRSLDVQYSNGDPSSIGVLSLAANEFKGWVVEFDNEGSFVWINEHSNVIPPGVSSYLNDLEIHNDTIYGVGLNALSTFNLNGDLLNSKYLPVTGYEELDISDSGKIFAIGWDNTSKTNFSTYNLDWTLANTINPGQASRSKGHSVSYSNNEVAILAGSNNDFIYPEYPNNSMFSFSNTSQFKTAMFVGVYECVCPYDSDSACCDEITASIVGTESGDYCCSLIITNDSPYPISTLEIQISPQSSATFDVGQFNAGAGYTVEYSDAATISLSHTSGSLPLGSMQEVLSYCVSDNDSGADVQEYIVSFFESREDKLIELCSDTISSLCAVEEMQDCGMFDSSFSQVRCSDDPHLYNITFSVTNSGSFPDLTEFVLSGLPMGFHWVECGTIPPAINQDISFDGLGLNSDGVLNGLCVQLYSDHILSNPMDLEFNVTYFSDSLFCMQQDVTIALEPCCDDCNDIDILVEELKPCCFTLSFEGFCDIGQYEGFLLPTTEDFDLSFSDLSKDWDYCRAPNGSQCFYPISGSFDDNYSQNIVTLCLSDVDDFSNSIDFQLFESYDPVKGYEITCESSVELDCGGTCVTKGFKDPVLTMIGQNDFEKIKLECDMPPLYLNCPKYDELFLTGFFDCSEKCKGSVEVSLYHNGEFIDDIKQYNSDGTWELYLNNYVDETGEYTIVVTGECDGEVNTCSYSIVIREECNECSCNNLKMDIEQGFHIQRYDGCLRGFSPNVYRDCDFYTWSVDGQNYETTVGDKEFIFEFDPGLSTYDICFEIYRDEGSSDCTDQYCEAVEISCFQMDSALFECPDGSNENGDLSVGIQGSIHGNERNSIPGWNLIEGEAWYFERAGSTDLNSGYIKLIANVFEDTRISTLVKEIKPDNNSSKLSMSFDARVNMTTGFQIKVLMDGEELASETVLNSLEGNWNYFELEIPLDLPEYAVDKLEVQICCIDTSEGDTETSRINSLDIDNVCIELYQLIISTENQSTLELILYPNPAMDQVLIESSELIREITIHGIDGTLIQKTASPSINKIDLNGIPGGVYLVRLKSDNKRITKKLIVLE